MSDRRIAMVGFLQAQNCSNFPASWRHPESAGDFMTPEYYRRIARTLEDGKFHLAFFDDRLAMPDRFGDDFTESVRHGVRSGQDGPDPRSLGHGCGDQPARTRRDLLDDVLRAVPRRADVRDAGPHDRGAGRLERRDRVAQRLRGRELRRRRGGRPRPALRPRRRVRRGGARALEGVGARRHRARQGGRRVRGRVQGAAPRPPRPVLQVPRTVHRTPRRRRDIR